MKNIQDLESQFRDLLDDASFLGCKEAFITSVARIIEEKNGPLQPKDTIWYVDDDEKIIERGIVSDVLYKGNQLLSFSVDFPDTDEFDEFNGTALGTCFFTSEEMAKSMLRANIN